MVEYKRYIQGNWDVFNVHTDTFESSTWGYVLLVTHFINCQLMYLPDHNTSKSVIDIFDEFEKELCSKFRKLFPVILPDNGNEFTNPDALKLGGRTKIFYYNTNSTYPKEKIDKSFADSFSFFYGDDFFRILGIELIPLTQ